MFWTKCDVGKFKGKTLPEVFFQDPEWIFDKLGNKGFNGALINEAIDICNKAQHIKPKPILGKEELLGYYSDYETGDISILKPVSKTILNSPARGCVSALPQYMGLVFLSLSLSEVNFNIPTLLSKII